MPLDLQAIKENSQRLLDAGVVMFSEEIENNVKLVAEVERLREANEKLSLKYAVLGEENEHILERARVAEEENEIFREALEFYAKEESYERVENTPDIHEGGYEQPTWEPSWIELDRGLLARKVLEGER